jgi:glycosyltransferase involved in cell wall biosynthesis
VHPAANELLSNPVLEAIHNNFHNFDLITVSTDRLGQELGAFAKPNCPIVTLPNCIDPDAWIERKKASTTLRIGFTGSASHLSDLLFLTRIITRLQKRYDFEFHIFGVLPDFGPTAEGLLSQAADNPALQQVLRDLIAVLPETNYIHHDFVSTAEYPHALANLDLDIGLCYVAPTLLNECRSPLKFYEYAMVGTATLATDIITYRDCNFVTRDEDFAQRLEYLITNPTFREELARSQRSFVLKNRTIDHNIHLWERAYGSLFS